MIRTARMLASFLAAAGLTTTWLGVVHVTTAAAQSQPPAQSDQAQPPAQSDQKADISDQKLDAAAAAIKQVAGIKEAFVERLESAPQSDKEQIVKEAEEALVKAVTEQGLSVSEYSSILVVAQNDPEVKRKIIQRLRPSQE
jgi:hypothetical protein